MFKCTTHALYAPGTLVQLVGYDFADEDDRDEDEEPVFYVHAVSVFEDEAEWPDNWSSERWYFRVKDLRPLTPAARAVLDDLRVRTEHVEGSK